VNAPAPAHYSREVEKKHGEPWYEWCVFVQGSSSVLDTIDHVAYTLHPTFEDPLRVSEDRRDCFALYSAGWGGFTVGVEIFFKSGALLLARHNLTLERDSWPKRKPKLENLSQLEQKVHSALHHSTFRWRKVSTIVRESGLSLEQVRLALRNMAARNYARPAFFKGIGGEELWGATAVVGLAPEPGR